MSEYTAHGSASWSNDVFTERVLAESGRRTISLSPARRAVVLQALFAEAARLRAAQARSEERRRWLNGVLSAFTPRRLGSLGAVGALALLITGYVLFGGMRISAQASLTGVAAVSERRVGPFGLQWNIARPSGELQAYALHRGDEILAISEVTIIYADGSKTVAQPGTRFSLLPAAAGIALIEGEVANTITPAQTGEVKFRVESASGSIVVKGTEFRVRTEGDASVTEYTDKGRVGVSTSAGTIDVVTGEQARLAQGVAPTAILQVPRVSFATSVQGRVVSEQPRVPFSTRIFPGATLVVRYADTNETFATFVANAEGLIADTLPPILGTASLRFSQTSSDGRVSAQSTPVEIVVDEDAPVLGVTRVQRSGNTVTIAGRTERAATVRVNGEAVVVDSDGTFSTQVKVIPGMASITIAATDPAGNTTTIVQSLQ